MADYPPAALRLVAALRRLPGIGPRSAERLVAQAGAGLVVAAEEPPPDLVEQVGARGRVAVSVHALPEPLVVEGHALAQLGRDNFIGVQAKHPRLRGFGCG